MNIDVAKKEQRSNGLYFFVATARRKLMGFGPDICQYLWNGELNEMVLGFWCICVWVGVSKVSQYPREIKIKVPG